MPDLKESLQKLNLINNNQTETQQTPVDNNGLSTGDISLFKNLGLDKLFGSTETAGLTNTGFSNEGFDPDRTDFNRQVSNNTLNNWYNTFRRSWLDMNITTELGKMNLDMGEFGEGTLLGANQAAEEVIDNYSTDLQNLDNQRQSGQLNEADYLKQVTTLEQNFTKAQQIVSEGNQKIAEYENKMNEFPVSRGFEARTRRALQKGDDLGFVENMTYAMPQTLGSSASLMIPQMAAAFGAGFAKSAATTIASTAGLGSEAAPIVGTVVGTAAALATLVWGRAQESYGEVGSLVKEAREKLMADYMQKYQLSDPSEIPEDVMRNIRIQSRKGSDTLFKENMALVAPDLATALLLPMNTLGKTIGLSRLGRVTGNVGELLNNAKNYNLWTKGLAFAAGRRYAQALEQFEEGFQYAASDRAKDEIYGLDEYQNKGFIKNLLDDAYNTVSSLNYTLLPGVTPELRGSGKYALDPEFQASDNSGALLALIMSSPTSAMSIGSELMAYRKAKQDVINNGLFDVDSKFQRLNASLLKSYFEKGQTERLVNAIRAVGNKTDAEGNLYYTPEQGQKAISDIKDLYNIYSSISNNVDNLPKDSLFGFKDSREQKAMKDLFKEDALTVSMNLKRQGEELGDLQSQYLSAQQNNIITGEDPATITLKDLRAKQEALNSLLDNYANNEELASQTAPKGFVDNIKQNLRDIQSRISQEEENLQNLNIDTENISSPSIDLVEANKNMYSLEGYIRDQKEKYSELNKVRTQADLVDYYNRNKNRTNLSQAVQNITGREVDNPITETRTNDEIINGEVTGYDPDPANQEEVTPDIIQQMNAQSFTPTGDILTDATLATQLQQERQEDNFKTAINDALKVPEINTPAISTLLKDQGIDIKNNTFESTWNTLRSYIEDPNLLRDNFDSIKNLVLSEQTNSDLLKDTEGSFLDENTLDISGKSSFHTYDDSKVEINNKETQKSFKEVLEPNPAPGFKIVDPMSIANRQVGYEGRTDSYENGKLVFKDSGDDQHITNTNIVKPGVTVTISIDNPDVLEGLDSNTDLDSDLNQMELGIYITNVSDGITIPLKIGSLHTTDYYSIDTFAPIDMSIEEARNIIRIQRKNILKQLKQNPNTSFESTITSKGFGHLNLNQTSNTIQNVIGSDTRPYLTIINESGFPIQIDNKSTYQGIKGLEKGASILMLPNDVNGVTQYIPIYLSKQPISSDQAVYREVIQGLNTFLKGQDNVWSPQLDDWLYITRNPADRRKLVNNGVVLENKRIRGEKSVSINNIIYSYNRNNNTYKIQGTVGNPIEVSEDEFYNGLNRQGVIFPGFNVSVGNLYPSLNKNKLLNPKDTNKNYQRRMMASTVYQTKVAANTVLLNNPRYNFLSPDEQYQYFSQHTIAIDQLVKAVGETITTNPIEVTEIEPTERIDNIQEALGDDFIFDIDNTPSSFDIDNPVSTTDSLRDEIYISKDDMPYSVQQEVVSSVAYMLLNNNPDTATEDITNEQKVRFDFENRYNKANSVLSRTKPDAEGYDKLSNLVNYYRISLDNWDKVIQKSKDILEEIGFVSNEETGYYDNLEESIDNTEDPENVQFNDDGARTRNIIDFIPSEVKKLLWFIPAYRKLDPRVASDVAIMERTGGIEYTPEGNSLGLPYFNNFNDTWTKALTVLSRKYFESDRTTGWVKMLNTLADKSNAIVVQELAKKLQTVPVKVQNAFFTSTNLQLQKNLTTKTEFRDNKFDGKVSTSKTTRIIASDRNSSLIKLTTQLRQEFNNTPDTDIKIGDKSITGNILKRSVDSVTGRVINVVDIEFGRTLYNTLRDILKDPNSYTTYIHKATGQIKPSTSFTPEAQQDIYNLVLASGINLSYPAFNDFIKSYFVPGTDVRSPKSAVQTIFESRIFKTIAGESNRSSETEDVSKTDNDKNNPFVMDYSSINSLAYYELKYRSELQQGAFRQDGKSYYPFIRHHYLSEIFNKLTENVNEKQDKTEYSNILGIDRFASTSQTLQEAVAGRLNNLELDYELGSTLVKSDQGVKLLKEMNEREHQITKMALYQNSGNKSAYFFYDTLSDKSTMPIIRRNRIDIEYNFDNQSIDLGNIELTGETINELYRYFEAEYRRIKEVDLQNDSLDSNKKIKGYHNIGKKEGMGNKFLIYTFLNKAMLDVDNPELSAQLYNSAGRLGELTPTIIDSIKRAINNHFNIIFKANKEDAAALRLYTIETDKTFKADISSLVDRNYLLKGNTNSIFNKIGISNNSNAKSFATSFDASRLGIIDTNKIIDYSIIDYVVNYALKTNEMLQLTGDPAQMGKLEKISYSEENSKASQIRKKYKNLPNSDLLEAKDILQLHISSTLVNVNKRNAAFLGSGSKGLFDTPDYRVTIANDIAINSDQVEQYKALFPGREEEIEDKYVKGDIADAQEFTTVKEHLNVMLAFGKITPQQYRRGLYIYDIEDYRNTFGNQSESISRQDREDLYKIIFQPAKPVQRIGILDAELKATKHYYIKTSSFPIFPDLVKGTPMENMLNDMKSNKVDRVAFVSGVKLGVAGSRDIFSANGEYNPDFFKDNVNILNRNGFRIQLEVPYKPDKSEIREGTQQAKIIFVDVDDNITFNYNNKRTKGSELKSLYRQLHQNIFDLKRDKFLKEINAEFDGIYKFNNVNELASILQREAIDRGYGLNSILGLDVNNNGRFKIPLTFSPVAGKIEPVITAMFSNRLAKMKLPGHSYIQGSEFLLKTVQSDENLDQRNIIWTDPKYSNTSKLQYLRDENGTIKGAQILIAPYFVIGKQKLDIRNFLREENGSTYIDTTKIDPELLSMNGFRIPFQGHNSGMWFEIIGFLPEESGDLAIVPGEIAAQMGSDYDVDKLYSYMYNYYYDGNKIKKVTDSTTIEQINKNAARNRKLVTDEMGIKGISRQEALEGLGLDSEELDDITQVDLDIMKNQNSIIDIHQAVYTNRDLFTSILNPLSFDVVNQAIDETEQFSPQIDSVFTGIYDPLYQRTFYFSNKGGKLGCLGYGTKIIMYDGTIKEVQDIKVGDQLMGPDSTPRNVLNLCRNREQMYWVHQKRGISYRVNESHILSLKIRNFQNIKDEVCNIKLSDYLDTSISFQNNTYGYKAKGIELSYKEVPLSPYYLGLWLGDGSKKSACAISNVDKEIREYLDNTYGIHRVEGLNNLTMFLKSDIINEGFKKAFNRSTSALLPTENKYIPDLYLYNSKEVRLQLLAGLIDSDGTYSKKNKQYVIATTDENFRDQICYLTRSLGFYTSWSLIKGITKKYPNGKTYTNKDYYNIRFIPECEIPVLLDRKKYQGKSEFKDRLVTSIFLERDIVDNYYGFELDGDHLFLLEDFTVTHNTAISALANTSHAQSQISNLFIKGQGIVIEDENGNIFQDSGNTNRTNEYTKDIYTYSAIQDGERVDVNQDNGLERSAWRLDKVDTFPDSQGRTYKISDLISQILGVSVDNAKEQVLGKFGINAQNFNTTLTIVRAGFDLATTKKFITQPILQELYGVLDSLNDMYTIDYTADKKNKAIKGIIDKYIKQYGLSINSERFLQRPNLVAANIGRMEDALREGQVTQGNVLDQLEILKAYLKYSDISDNLQALNRAFNMDSRGLPKNISDTLQKEEDYYNIVNSPYIGNINKYQYNSLPGVYISLPWIVNKLFTSESDPLFAYNSLTYRTINNSILEITGRDTLYSNQKDILNNNIKQFIYTSFINNNENLQSLKERLLLDTEESPSLVTRFNDLYKKYPRDKFLSAIDTVTSIYPDNPKLLEIKMSSEDNYVQVVSEAWEYAYIQNSDSELRQFAEDLFKYALAVSPQEFGSSSIIRYIPMTIMEQTGFVNYLDETHKALNDEELSTQFEVFNKQFLQHYPEFALSIKQDQVDNLFKSPDGKIVTHFKLSNIDSNNSKSQAIRRIDNSGNYYYPQYLSFFTNPEIGKQLYEKIESPEGTFYFLVPHLGINNVTEYDLSNIDQTSMFEENKVSTQAYIDSSAIIDMLKENSDVTPESNDINNISATQLLSQPRTPEYIIEGIQSISNRYKFSNNSFERKVATYYSIIADQLSSLNYTDVTITNTTDGNSRTSNDGKNIFINTNITNKADNKAGLNAELNTVRVLLHELLHSAVFRQLSTGNRSEEFNDIQTVYDVYRTTIWDSRDRIRGVNSQTLTGELLDVLLSNYRTNLNSGSTDLDVNTISIPDNLTDERLRDLLNKVSPKMKQLAREGKIDSNESLYNFSSDPDREKDFFKFIRDTFVGANNFKRVINKYYPYISIQEFIVESTTNPETQILLKGIPGILTRIRTAITNILNKIFGISEGNRTLFNDAIDAVFNFISPEEIKEKNVSLPESELDLNITDENVSEDLDISDPEVINQILNLPCA